MSPTEDIVPITYMSGTGGNFLCHFIVSAKRNIKTIIELSEHGNAHHKALKDISGPPYGPRLSDQNKIDFMMTKLEQKINHPTNFFTQRPFYTCTHIVDIDLINTYFKKSVRITYDQDDIKEIAVVFYGKWGIDEGNSNWLTHNVYYIKAYQSKFTELKNMPNVLFISWKELFRGNIEELITKISIFTDINHDNFSRESLIHWRNKTQYCIDTFSETK